MTYIIRKLIGCIDLEINELIESESQQLTRQGQSDLLYLFKNRHCLKMLLEQDGNNNKLDSEVNNSQTAISRR